MSGKADKTFADFDFDFQPSLDRKVVGELSTLRFVEEHRSVIRLGPPGVRKTDLAIALGIAANEAGYRAYFISASDLAKTLRAAHVECLAHLKLRTCTHPSLPVIDELGCPPLDQAPAKWIFQAVSRRYDRGSVILTANRGFSDWGPVFARAVVAGAIGDRLLHDATVLNRRGHRHRMRAYQEPATRRREPHVVG
ncbi:MAG: ATP-binding protein [Candidatus Dormibacteraeota bacterium]|jgi:DNA replication protein DnaC|nr:ATP-binding protein [Candidatus Dormibacteraeota bacterium]